MTATDVARPSRSSVVDLVGGLLDAPLASWDTAAATPPAHADTLGYRKALREASERAGTDESVVTGEGLIQGRRIAVIANEFTFLAGSIGLASATRIVEAVERATAEQLPLVAIASSGGTRMQEGTMAFLAMPGIAAAVAEHKAAGLPYIAYLRHPTTGGVLASWGSLGTVTLAEPRALIGFLGPKVYAALNGTEFPKGVQLAENLLEHGIVDAVVPSCELRPTVLRILEHLDGPLPSAGQARSSDPIANGPDAWECITTTRSPDRPGLRALLNRCSSAFVLGGPDRTLATDSTLLAIARVGGHACVVFGHDREAQQQGYPPGPTALRRAQRAMQLARDLRLPLVTVIDTSGTELSVDAEQHGTAREIANCLAAMATLDTPTVSVVLGQGCGGGALALLPADRTVAANHGWITPLPPEGASVILHGDPDLAPAVARQQRITAMDLCDNGIVDCLVDDSGSQAEFVARTLSSIEDQIQIVSSMGSDARRTARRRRWRIVTP